MIKLRQICIINNQDEENYLLEGKIIIQEDGTFEGIIDSSNNNIYVSGKYSSNKEKITFHTIESETNKNTIRHYIFITDLYSLKYIGYEIDSYGHEKYCNLYIIDNFDKKEIVQTKINDLSYIIKDYKSMMEKRNENHKINNKTLQKTKKEIYYI